MARPSRGVVSTLQTTPGLFIHLTYQVVLPVAPWLINSKPWWISFRAVTPLNSSELWCRHQVNLEGQEVQLIALLIQAQGHQLRKNSPWLKANQCRNLKLRFAWRLKFHPMSLRETYSGRCKRKKRSSISSKWKRPRKWKMRTWLSSLRSTAKVLVWRARAKQMFSLQWQVCKSTWNEYKKPRNSKKRRHSWRRKHLTRGRTGHPQ